MKDSWAPLPQSAVVTTKDTTDYAAFANVDTPRVHITKPHRTLLGFQWGWEAAGCFVAVGCVAAIAVLVSILNDMALQDAHLKVSPNAIVSVLAVASKAALLLPVASCIGQLKWTALKRPSSSMVTLQNYDEASRGPLGSFMLITLRLHGVDFLAFFGALIMILSIAFDPFAQQIIHYSSESRPVRNATAAFPTTSVYDMGREGLGMGSYLLSTKDPPLQAAMVSGLYERAGDPAYTCPGAECRFPAYSTLGGCGSCKDLTSQVKVSCRDKLKNPDTMNSSQVFQACDYKFPDNTLLHAYLNHDSYYGTTYTTLQTTAVIGREKENLSAEDPERSSLLEFSSIKFDPFDPLMNPNSTAWRDTVKADVCRLELCVRGHDEARVVNGSLAYTNQKSAPLRAIKYAPKKGDVPDLINYSSPSPQPLWPKQDLYTISNHDLGSMTMQLQNLLISNNTQQAIGSGSLIYTALYTSRDLGHVFSQIADSMTYHFARGPNSTTVNGTVYSPQTIIHVQWAWLILPTAIVLGTCLLLAGTLLHLAAQDRPTIWKSSILPFLLLPQDARVHPASAVAVETGTHTSAMRRTARERRVDLAHERDGGLSWLISDRRHK